LSRLHCARLRGVMSSFGLLGENTVAADIRQKLIGLLDYVEQVVRLDERVAFKLSEYRLPDGATFAVSSDDTQNLPGVRHDHNDEDGPVWLEVDRLSRKEPPARPDDIADWVAVSSDPAKAPDIRSERLITVTAVEKDAAIASGAVRADDVLEAPRKRGEPADAPLRYDLKLRLEDRPEILEQIHRWIAGPWTDWSTSELPRRRTISLYQRLYKIFQLREVGAAESPIEVIWGIGGVDWQKDGRIVDRPLLERRVDIELDDKRGGLIRVRPAGGDAQFDLKPYEELGCANLPSLADLMRREIQRSGENEGVSPFARESFEPILSAAAARLDPDGCYAPEHVDTSDSKAKSVVTPLTVTDRWVLFARPRSQHIVLQDIDRLRASTAAKETLEGLPERLVTEPANEVSPDGWQPLSTRIGGSGEPSAQAEQSSDQLDVFFPKPFNDDQLEIIRRLSKADGLVVQGPPGTGKTHTIANLICHAMATGQRVPSGIARRSRTCCPQGTASERSSASCHRGAFKRARRSSAGRGGNPRDPRRCGRHSAPKQTRDDPSFGSRIGWTEKSRHSHRCRIGRDCLGASDQGRATGRNSAELAKRIVAERNAFCWLLIDLCSSRQKRHSTKKMSQNYTQHGSGAAI
jgi:hypothetical protein